ncbi:hypothetical protein B0O80DRAFT_459228 [Mortierella sp. GBAus27b]|nr:hypothetical protein B0O80DRAFT_459228 [Mortierella sp. GBAus27b]
MLNETLIVLAQLPSFFLSLIPHSLHHSPFMLALPFPPLSSCTIYTSVPPLSYTCLLSEKAYIQVEVCTTDSTSP